MNDEKIVKHRWYKVIIDGQEHIVWITDRILKYCITDYYDDRVWTHGSLAKCKNWIRERRPNNGNK